MYIRNEKGFSFFSAEISPQCTQKSRQIGGMVVRQLTMQNA